MEKAAQKPSILFFLTTTLLLLDGSVGEPRAQTVQIMCGRQLNHNSSIYVPNFVATVENISWQMRTSGFGVAVTGSGIDINYGLAQCYGHLSLLDCVLCYAEARTVLPQCFPYNGGRIFLNGCFMRAENYSFFQQYTGPEDRALCGNTTQKNFTFQETAMRALLQAVSDAPNNKTYARVQATLAGTANETAYVQADCWRTLNTNACRTCLVNAYSSILGCLPWSEGRALNTGCFLRYSDTNFLNPVPGKGISRGNMIVIIVAVVSSAVILVIAVYVWKHREIQKRRGTLAVGVIAKVTICCCCCWRKCSPFKRKDHVNIEALLEKYGPLASKRYMYSDIKKMTNSFKEKVGEGGYGRVYKGKLHDGRVVAVKILNILKGNGEEFVNEVASISRTSHVNIVTLLGFCFEGSKRALIYEFMHNGSLEKFIYNEKSTTVRQLGWKSLYEIALGIARGLEYLHRGCNTRILHFDIKPHNILLNEEFCPKISDFGLAKLCPEKNSIVPISGMRGTPGYIAPEVYSRNFGGVSHKSDVYSYGMMILEMVGRRKNSNEGVDHSSETYFPEWIYNHLEQDEEIGLNDITNGEARETTRNMIIVGLWCIQMDPSNRPSMRRVLDMLEGSREPLRIPPRPILDSPPRPPSDYSTTETSQ